MWGFFITEFVTVLLLTLANCKQFCLHIIHIINKEMKTEQLQRLLNTACDIITSLEHHADESLQKDINALFDEIIASDDIEDEIRVNYSADDEAQDWNIFNKNKI